MTDHPSALVSVPEPMIEAFRDWYALHFGRPIMKGKARKIVGRILSAAPAAPQAAGVGERADLIADLEALLAAEPVFVVNHPIQRAINALRAPSREPEGGARRFRHWARGTTYVEVGEARLQQSGQFGPCEGDAITVYRGEDGQLWARASSEFHDGRFEELPALATREEAPAEAGSFEERAIALVKKYGNPNGSDYEQGQNDMGHRMVTMAREADAALRAQPQAREDAQPVISAGRVLADALRQYGFPVSGGAKATLSDHGSAEALALNEACVAFLAALQAEQGAK